MAQAAWDSGDLNGRGGGSRGGGASVGLVTDPNAREFGTILQVISEGPILGLVNGLKSVQLDDTPIMDAVGNPNFKGVALALVAGTNTQAMIPGFTDAESETSVNVKVSIASGAVTRTISTTGISAVRVRIAIPSLKVINATSGAESGAGVRVKVEKQSPSWNGGAWATETLEGSGIIIGKFGSKYTRSYRIETPAAGPWSIRVSRLTPDHTSGAPDYTQDETWWDAYTEITDAKLRYPYSAVMALKVDAKQFQQIPKLTGDFYGRILDCVPSNYNPMTRAYTGIWDGTFKSAWTDNPAWIWYDMASHTRYGAGTVLAASKLDKWALYTIAQACDVLVSDGKGGTEPRFRCSLYLQNQEEAIKLLQDMASIFRGMIYWAGGLVTAVQDVDGPVEAIFTNSNVKDGRFTYQGSARKSRHTAALVSWQDPQNGYQTSVEYVEDQSAIARYGYNPTQVAALGATSQAQARRLGLWTLLTETMDTEVTTFSSGLEGSTVRPGSIIGIQDQFRAGDGRLGGRILAGATTTVIPLDGPCTLPAGTNTLSIRQADGTVETSTVTTAAGTVSSLTVSPAFTVAPPPMNQWALNMTLYRVISIKKGEGIYWEVSALQHTPGKYALVDGVTVTPGPATPDSALTVPSALTLGDVVRIEKDKLVQSLKATWTGDATALYAADASQDYGEWQPMKVNATSATLDPITPGSWRVRVRAVYPLGASPWVTGTATVATPTATATDAAAAASAAAAAQTGVNTINDPDTLTTGEKPQIILDYNAVTGENADLVAKANAYGVSHATYDTAYSALLSYLATLTSPTAWNSLSGTTSLGTGNRVALWNPKWAAVKNAAADLRNAIAVGTAQNAISTAATDATNKANAAQLASQPHQVAWAYASKPALPNPAYPAGYYAITTDARTVQVNAAGTAWTDVLVAATGLFGQLISSQLTVVNLDNLIPNGTSDQTPPPGGWPAGSFESAWLDYSGANAYSGNYARAVNHTNGADSGTDLAHIPCSAGDKYYMECMAKSQAPGFQIINCYFLDASNNVVGWGTRTGVTSTTYAKASCVGTAPAGAVLMIIYIEVDASQPSGWYWFDNLYARRMADASMIVDGTLQALVARVPLLYSLDLRSGSDASGYTAGTAVSAPIGFRISATPFTTTYIGGTTDSNCMMELGGPANFGGYKVATVNSRIQPVNRIINGYFYTDLNGWSTSGATPPTYQAASATSGTGSAAQYFVGGFGYTKAGNLTQSFSMPQPFPGQTVSLAYKTGYYGNGANSGSDVCTIQVYILNQSTGTETLLATHTYSNANVALAWTARSVDITSYVSAGGQFSIRFAMTVNDSHVAGSFTNGVYVDEVTVIA